MIANPEYTGPESEFVYNSCLQVAREALTGGRPVVLDGTFTRSYQRVKALAELHGLYGQCVLVHAMCSIDTARLRNASRIAVVPEERLQGINAHFEEPLEALKLDTDAHSAEENANIVLSALAHEVEEALREYTLEPAAAV
jgi:predicted kinase